MLPTFSFWPRPASNFAASVDAIFFSLLAVCGLIVLGLGATMIFFCWRYRRGAPARRTGKPETSFRIEIFWASLTLLAFLGIFGWSARIYYQMAQPPADATEIQVVGKQWMWKAQHANGRREINELHLLVGQPVKLLMTSQDVIHDFFIPAFHTKQDVLPGRFTREWFTPIKVGSFHLFCAEYCGMDHSQMGGWIHVLEPAEYARWLAAERPEESLTAAGARLFQARGCAGCHAPGATVRAPMLEGIFNHPVALADRTVVRADEQYLYDSILQPNKQVAAGYEAIMPTYQGQLSEEEVMALVAYLKDLGNSPTPLPNQRP